MKSRSSLTLLMDASARVHATTGLLPRHQVSLPAEAARLAGLINEFYIGVAPVLGERPGQGASRPTMPRPSDAFGQWSWATRPEVTDLAADPARRRPGAVRGLPGAHRRLAAAAAESQATR